eukprot:c6251_g1_i1.p1 GENE.c6251_g1_i1~~c6251_g1_i1.p1  ORF type:complete len:127 (-),score=1.94 c6251_g1_i1:90-434(-)
MDISISNQSPENIRNGTSCYLKIETHMPCKSLTVSVVGEDDLQISWEYVECLNGKLFQVPNQFCVAGPFAFRRAWPNLWRFRVEAVNLSDQVFYQYSNYFLVGSNNQFQPQHHA